MPVLWPNRTLLPLFPHLVVSIVFPSAPILQLLDPTPPFMVEVDTFVIVFVKALFSEGGCRPKAPPVYFLVLSPFLQLKRTMTSGNSFWLSK